MRPATEIVLLALLTLAIRLAAWKLLPSILPDSVDLLDSADAVARGVPGALLAAHHHPIPVWLIAHIGAGRDADAAASITVAVAAALAIWPLHVLTRSACGRHGATIACLLYAVLPKFVSIGSIPLAEGFFIPAFIAAFAAGATAHVGRTPTARILRLVVAGLFAGAAYLCRPEGLVAGLAVPALAFAQARPRQRLTSAAIVLGAFLVVSVPWVVALSSDRGMFALTPKKEVAKFIGLEAAPHDGTQPDGSTSALGGTVSAIRAACAALWGALEYGLVMVVAGALPRRRWGPRSRHMRLVLLLSAAILFVLLMRLKSGWDYAGGRHAVGAAVLLLPYAGEGAMFLVSFFSRTSGRRSAALVLTGFASVHLAVLAILRPDSEPYEREHALGTVLAARAETGGDVVIASFQEALVAHYADRALREETPPRRARNVRLMRDYETLLQSPDFAAERTSLAATLRHEGAQWLVLDVFTRGKDLGANRHPGRELAERLIADGVIGTSAVAAGSELAAYPVLPAPR